MTKSRLGRLSNLIPLFSCFLLFNVIILSSCKKIGVPTPEQTVVRFVHSSPTLGAFNVYLNDGMLNKVAVPFGGVTSYATTVAAKHTIKFTTGSNSQSVLLVDITLTKDKIFSLYVIGKDDKIEVLPIIDDASISSTTKAFVKFINLSPDAPALSLDIAEGANLFASKTYKTGTEFVQVDPKTYNFNIKDSATGAIKTTLKDVEFAAGRYYTIISRGMLNPGTNDQPFSAQSIINQ